MATTTREDETIRIKQEPKHRQTQTHTSQDVTHRGLQLRRHWVELFPFTQSQNSYVDYKMSPECLLNKVVRSELAKFQFCSPFNQVSSTNWPRLHAQHTPIRVHVLIETIFQRRCRARSCTAAAEISPFIC